MEFSTFLWTTAGAFLTLATFSFLYKDNPFYKIAEHLVVGVATGYFTIILWHNGLVPNLFRRLADGDWYYFWLNSTQPLYLVPAILGLLMWTRFSRNYSWVSRWPMALYIGISTGVAIPLEMKNRVNEQLFAMMKTIDWSNFWGNGFLDMTSGYSEVIIFAGTLCGLIYFFFSKSHTGVFGGFATFGIWILMMGFGASFGFTVMARISLFIQRVQYIHQDWGSHAFDPNNQYLDWRYQFVFWVIMLVIVVYVLSELLKYLKKNSNQPTEAT